MGIYPNTGVAAGEQGHTVTVMVMTFENHLVLSILYLPTGKPAVASTLFIVHYLDIFAIYISKPLHTGGEKEARRHWIAEGDA